MPESSVVASTTFFKRRGHGAGFDGDAGSLGVLKEQVVAQLGHGQRRFGGPPARAGHGVSSKAGLCFHIGGERVAHAGEEHVNGRGDADPGVYQNDLGVLGPKFKAVEAAVLVVPHGAGRGGGVARGSGGADDVFEPGVVGHGLGKIQRLAAAHADDDIAALFLHFRRDLVAGGVGALAGEHPLVNFHAGFLQSGQNDAFGGLLVRLPHMMMGCLQPSCLMMSAIFAKTPSPWMSLAGKHCCFQHGESS